MPAKRKKAAAGGTLGARIRRFRLAKGLTQADLGRLIGVSQRNVAYYEVKGVSPPPELLVKIADALDVFDRSARRQGRASHRSTGDS